MIRKILFVMLMMLPFVGNDTRCCCNYMETFLEKKADDWEALIWALCEEESGNNDKAINKESNAYGRFQMLKIYVDECNRILGYKEFTYADRGDKHRAREMFEIYQGYHNPKGDIDKAIIIHRGKKDWGYYWRVKNKIKERKEK